MLKNTSIAIIVLLAPSGVLAASYDCGKASTPIEKTICADPVLSQLDEALAKYYKSAIVSANDGGASLKSGQREWLSGLRECGQNQPALSTCLKAAYQDRISFLKSLAFSDSPLSQQPQSARQDERSRQRQEAARERQARQAEWEERTKRYEEQSQTSRREREARKTEELAERTRRTEDNERAREAERAEVERRIKRSEEARREQQAEDARKAQQALEEEAQRDAVRRAEDEKKREQERRNLEEARKNYEREQKEREELANRPENKLLASFQKYQYIQKCYEVRQGFALVYISQTQFDKVTEEVKEVQRVLKPAIKGKDVESIWKEAADMNNSDIGYKIMEANDFNVAKNSCDVAFIGWRSIYTSLVHENYPKKNF